MPNSIVNAFAPCVGRIEQTLNQAQRGLERQQSSFLDAVQRIYGMRNNPVELARYTMRKLSYLYPPPMVNALPCIFPPIPKPVPVKLNHYPQPGGPKTFPEFKFQRDPEFRRLENHECIKKLTKAPYLGPQTRELIRQIYNSAPNNLCGRLVNHLIYRMRTIAYACKLDQAIGDSFEALIGEIVAEARGQQLNKIQNQFLFESIFHASLVLRLMGDESISLKNVFKTVVGLAYQEVLNEELNEYSMQRSAGDMVPDLSDGLAAQCLLQDALGLPTHHYEIIESTTGVLTNRLATQLGERVVDKMSANDHAELIDRILMSEVWEIRLQASPLISERSREFIGEAQADLAAFDEAREQEGSEESKLSEQQALDYINSLAGEIKDQESTIFNDTTRSFLTEWLRSN